MYLTRLKKIAEIENASFVYNDKNIAIGGGVSSPKVQYQLKIPYNDNTIIIYHETGTAYFATLFCKFKTKQTSLDFTLSTKSHFMRLFSKKKPSFKIQTENINITRFLNNSNTIKELSVIADQRNFTPYIVGKYANDSYTLSIKYHLEFDDWTDPVSPFIQFYKDFIDSYALG